jgi:hypothetical protein
MNIYRISEPGNPDLKPVYCGTLAAAQKHGKATTSPTFRGSIRIALIDVPADKPSMLRLLNEDSQWIEGLEVVREWRMTARGGLQETAN